MAVKKISGEIIEKGSLAVGPEQKLHPYILRVLTPGDLFEVMALQAQIFDSLEKKEYYVTLSEDELKFILAGGGEAVGLFIGNRLYAACSLLIDVDEKNNMARELGFDNEAMSQVAQLEMSLVDPCVRGYKLQCKMAGILAKRLEERGAARYLFTTVSPYNYASVQTVTALGMQIAGLARLYYDWDRYIVYRDLIQPAKLDPDNSVSVINTDLEKQRQLLKEGYRGFAQYRDEKGTMILYGKVL